MVDLDRLVQFRCVVCAAPMGECDCWHECECGWFYADGSECRNPVHSAPMPQEDDRDE